MAMYGIDISEHNGEINLDEYKDQFVIIRAGWGWSMDQKDRQFERNIRECLRLNIPFGVYWYSYAVDEETAKQEAEVFLEVIRPYRQHITMGVWVDQEDADGWKVRNGFEISRQCVSKITSLMCSLIAKEGYHTGIYCSYSWLNYLDQSCDFYDRWVAHWGTNDGTRQQDISEICSIHQYTSVPLDRDFCDVPLTHFRSGRIQLL